MFDYTHQISYNTDVNNIVFAYNVGTTCGLKQSPLDPYANFFDQSIFSPQNVFYGFQPVNIFKSQNLFQNNQSGMSIPWGGNIFSGNFGLSGNTNQIPTNVQNINIFKLGSSETPQTQKVAESSKATTPAKTTQTKDVQKTEQTKRKQTHVTKGDFRHAMAINAEKYLGYNEADGSFRKFSNSGEWCADFVAYIVKETCEQKGLNPPKRLVKLPDGAENRRVEDMKQWGIKNDKYLDLSTKSNKAKIITEKVHVGDILILRENGASHTGIVSKINKNGTFETIEGNRDDKVTKARYSPYNSDISGFVQLV